MNNIDMNDLVAYYNFDAGRGAVVIDHSPRGNHGTISGNAKWENGKYGLALSFELGTYIDLHGPEFQDKPDDAITICVWVNHQPHIDNQEIFDAIGTAHSDGLYHVEIRPDNTFRWYACNNDKMLIFNIDHQGAAPPNEWVHFAGTYSRIEGKAVLYVNGEKVAEDEGNLPLPTDWESAARIGQHRGGRWYVGLMDDFNMWRRALTQEEIRMIMDGVLTKIT